MYRSFRHKTKRVLIDVHGGGFLENARTESHLESVPVASIGKIKVISIDYRMGPEYVLPAASEDVAAVYQELLKEFKPTNIGLYGSSGGAMLVAQAVALFQQEKLPLPGAIGIAVRRGANCTRPRERQVGSERQCAHC